MGGAPGEKIMPYALCRHIKTNGTRCKAPSLTTGIWCYFHSRLHQRHQAFRFKGPARGYLVPGQHIELTALEDRESVQVSLSVVINALAVGNLDIKRATVLLYGLQLASSNARGLYTEPYASSVVRNVEPSPEGLDVVLEAPARQPAVKQTSLQQPVPPPSRHRDSIQHDHAPDHEPAQESTDEENPTPTRLLLL
jgi:hypothetical protein